MTLVRWVPFRNEGAAVRCRVFCFAHAAGSAALYRPLRGFMPPEIDFCPVELPGRAARLAEAPLTAIGMLMRTRAPPPRGTLAPGGHFNGAAGRRAQAADGSAIRFFRPQCR